MVQKRKRRSSSKLNTWINRPDIQGFYTFPSDCIYIPTANHKTRHVETRYAAIRKRNNFLELAMCRKMKESEFKICFHRSLRISITQEIISTEIDNVSQSNS